MALAIRRQNRPLHGRPKKLSARAQRHIQRLCLGNRRRSAASIAAEVEGGGGSACQCSDHMYCDILKQSMIPSLRRLGYKAVFNMITTTALLKLRVKVICGASSNRRWRSARSLTSTSSVMWSWRSGRGLQWQPVKLWWTPCPRVIRQCCKIMVATRNTDTLDPIWTFSLRGVLTFVASGLDINVCVLSYFEGTLNLHCYTSCTLTTLHCSKV